MARSGQGRSVASAIVSQLLVVVAGLLLGFGGARVLRRPASTAGAASVARSVGGVVGSRRGLDLPHLQRSVLSEMMRHVVGRGGAPTVPAAYRVRLHPADHATVAAAPGFFTQGLEQAMAAAGHDHGWTVPDRFRIQLDIDPSRRPGAPGVEVLDGPAAAGSAAPPGDRVARPTAPVRSTAPATPARPAAARVERSDRPGETVALTGDVVTIGRGPDRTIRIDDSRASRQHASLRSQGGVWTVTDDGSSNGTRVNGVELTAGRPQVLADGDRIGVGPVTLVFRTGPSR